MGPALAVAIGLAALASALPHPAAAIDPLDEFSVRKNLLIVSAPTMLRFVDASIAAFRGLGPVPVPRVEIHDSAAALERFCAGVGADHPDVAATTRRISRVELGRCHEAQVGDVVEIAIGTEVAGLFAKAGSPPLTLTSETLYRALAAAVPVNGEFRPNTARTWKDVDRSLPAVEIRVAVPPRGTPWRALFDDKVLQGGCRPVPEIRAITSATMRVNRCTNTRGDGRLIETTVPRALIGKLDSVPPETVMVLPLATAVAARQSVQAVALDGTLPSDDEVDSGAYPMARRLYFYFKASHMRDRKGYGVTLFLRDYLTLVASEAMLAPDGALPRLDLSPLPEEERRQQRRIAILLRPVDR